MSVTVTLVDRPDAGSYRESQRTYKVSDGAAAHTVRIRFHPDQAVGHVIENLVGGKWHRLLEGYSTDGDGIPFETAAWRAAAVLL